jgi:hypothetical protein
VPKPGDLNFIFLRFRGLRINEAMRDNKQQTETDYFRSH